MQHSIARGPVAAHSVPFNTGKVLIGCAYLPPAAAIDADAIAVQSGILAARRRDRLARASSLVRVRWANLERVVRALWAWC